MSSPIEQLRTSMAELADLKSTAQLLEWDQQTMMPEHGGDARAEALATVQRISHEKFIAPAHGRAAGTSPRGPQRHGRRLG